MSVLRDPIKVNVLWSVTVEEQFYLVWPLLLVFVPRRFRVVMAISVIMASVAGRFWLMSHGGTLLAWGFRVDALGVGAILAMLPLGGAPRVVKWAGALSPVVAVIAAGLTSEPAFSF